MTPSHMADLDLLYRAAQAEVGIIVAITDDLATVIQRLYAVRRKAADPNLESLVFRKGPGEGELAILKLTPKPGAITEAEALLTARPSNGKA